MEIEIDLSKTIDENAKMYFEKSKKAKRTIDGLKLAISKQKQKITKRQEKKIQRKQKWFEKYRWFISSDGYLVVGGKTAKQNEEIVKTYMKKWDVYFHAEVYGAPHCVIKKDQKNKLKTVPQATMVEAAEFAATFSKAFEQGISSADAYSVAPDQVSKKAPSGTGMGVGAFMIYGERNWFKKSKVACAMGYYSKEKILMCGPSSAIKKKCIYVIELTQGSIEKNQTAKLIQEKFKEKGLNFSNSDILSLLPNGNFNL